jgi:hypothetical protein
MKHEDISGGRREKERREKRAGEFFLNQKSTLYSFTVPGN